MSGTRIGWQLALPILDEIDENLTDANDREFVSSADVLILSV